jgi:NAD(P)-dependent dehydrogenase (short-subunit alcohol dehydrogenase family)
MEGKVVVITGATSGIGRETARELARLGATVAIIGRDAAKGRETLADLRPSARHPERVAFLGCDLASLTSVRALAAQLHERYEKIDVLINNAGVMNRKRRLTEDGFEETFAVNHLAHFLLTRLVLDLVKRAAPSRIINVSSNAHLTGKLDPDDLMQARRYTAFGAYAASKLANLYFTYELARKLDGTGVTVNTVHPGTVASNFFNNNGVLARLAMTALKPFFLTSAQGAETSVFLASSPQLEDVTGRYFYRRRQEASSPRSHEPGAARALWTASEKLTGISY